MNGRRLLWQYGLASCNGWVGHSHHNAVGFWAVVGGGGGGWVRGLFFDRQVSPLLLLPCRLPVLSQHCPTSRSYSTAAPTRFDTSKPFAYYEILGIPRTAKQSDVKQAYFRLAKIYHPDVNQDEFARENFDIITEAYTTLIDLTQRYFYDRHGFTSEGLKKSGTPSIFDWKPKYGIYNQEADEQATEVEDWFKAQGHAGYEEKITIRQRLKNAYVELRYGMTYYNFPWDFKSLAGWLLVWSVGLAIFYQLMCYTLRNTVNRRPIPIYLKWENDEIYDILWFAGARKNKPSDQSKGGLYHMPKAPARKSEYSHTIYSNTRSRTKSKHKERHHKLQKELRAARENSWSEETRERNEKIRNGKRKRRNDGFSV